MADNNEINASDCCGNGCANCVLDIKPVKSKLANISGKQHLLSNYRKLFLFNKTLHLPHDTNVWELHFKSKEIIGKQFILDLNPGYHLMMRKNLTDESHKSEIEQKYLLRPYSPYWWDVMELEFKILVNLKPRGPMSEYIAELQINDEVEFRGPIGSFSYETDLKGDKCLIIITQGVAIAPVIPIIEMILQNDDDMTRIIHLACFQDMAHIYFREKLYDFGKYWNYKSHIYLAKEICDKTDCLENGKCLEICKNFQSKQKYKENIYPYRLTQQELQKILTRLEHKKDFTFITLAGCGNFQNLFKDLFITTDFGFIEDNIYLL